MRKMRFPSGRDIGVDLSIQPTNAAMGGGAELRGPRGAESAARRGIRAEHVIFDARFLQEGGTFAGCSCSMINGGCAHRRDGRLMQTVETIKFGLFGVVRLPSVAYEEPCMLRLVLCSVAAVGMLVGLSVAKERPKTGGGAAHGHFVSFNNGTLTIANKKHGEKSFHVAPKTPARVWTSGQGKPQTVSAVAALQGLGPKARIVVHLGSNGKVREIAINPPHRPKKKKTS